MLHCPPALSECEHRASVLHTQSPPGLVQLWSCSLWVRTRPARQAQNLDLTCCVGDRSLWRCLWLPVVRPAWVTFHVPAGSLKPDQQLVSRLSSSLMYLQWNGKRTTSQASVLCTVALVHVRVWKGSCLGWKYLVLFTNTARKYKDVLLKISGWVSSSNGGRWLDVLLAQSKSSAGVKWQPVSGWILRTSGNVLYEKD